MTRTLDPVGMAIRITDENLEKIAIVNNGVAPEKELLPLYEGRYFIYPYAADAHATILPGFAFHQNWMFLSPEPADHDYFVEISEI